MNKLLVSTLSLALTMTTWSTFIQAADKKLSNPPTAAQFGEGGLTSVEVQNIHHSGKLLVKKIKVSDSTVVNGYLEAIESIFNKKTVINGNLDAKDSFFENLTVNGEVKFETVVVDGPTTINGKVTLDKTKFNNTLTMNGQLIAKGATFLKMITINSTNMSFDDCTIQDITVQKNSNDAEQKITLKSTKVLGNITFESGKGIIEQDSASSISGKVEGAIVKK